MTIANALLIDTNNTMTDNCTVSCSGDYGSVSIQIQGDGKDWDLILDPVIARQLIFDLHRAVMDALKEGAAA